MVKKSETRKRKYYRNNVKWNHIMTQLLKYMFSFQFFSFSSSSYKSFKNVQHKTHRLRFRFGAAGKMWNDKLMSFWILSFQRWCNISTEEILGQHFFVRFLAEKKFKSSLFSFFFSNFFLRCSFSCQKNQQNGCFKNMSVKLNDLMIQKQVCNVHFVSFRLQFFVSSFFLCCRFNSFVFVLPVFNSWII